MGKLLRADLYRMFGRRTFWFWSLCMCLIAGGLIFMQCTAMDYTVPFSRVIFLPMSFYGVVAAAMAGMYVSEDFASGFVRNKLIAGHDRLRVYLSLLAAVLAACAGMFALTSAFTAAVSLPLFELDASPATLLYHFALGLPLCLSYGAIYCALAVSIRDRAASVAACMGLSFAMLFLSMQLHGVLSRRGFAGGGLAALVYDLVPTCQAAQLSSMNVLHPVRFAALSGALIVASTLAGGALFRESDVR